MMAANTVKLTGFSQLSSTFKQVKTNVQDRALVRMVATGANVVKTTARKIVQSKRIVKSGALLNNIVLKREHDVPAGVVQYNVGVRHGIGGRGNGKKIIKARKNGSGVTVKYKNDPYYWFWVERGHRVIPRNTGIGEKLSIKERRKQADNFIGPTKSKSIVAGKPFLQPAFEQSPQGILNAMQKSLSASLVNLV
jgi:HK97 gp10 family phage protein